MNGKRWIRFGFLLAGTVNIAGILIFTKFFSNDLLRNLAPEVFSTVGIVSIILWGMAYISVAGHFDRVPFISGVFAIEKFFYAIVWVGWLKQNFNELGTIYQQDLITGFFYSVYGLNDFLFGVFFAIVFIKYLGLKPEGE